MTIREQATPVATRLIGHDAYGVIDFSQTPAVFTNPPEPPDYSSGSALFKYTQSDSRETPGWGITKTRYVQLPRKGVKNLRPVRKPVQPVFRPLKRPSPPIRKKGSSSASWGRAMRKYGARVADFEQRSYVALVIYNAHMVRYQKKLLNFISRTSQINRDRPIKMGKKRAAGKIYNNINNPYSKVKITDSQWDISYLYREYALFTALPTGQVYVYPMMGGNFILREQAYYGITGNTVPLTGHPFPTLPHVVNADSLVLTAQWKAINQLYDKLSDQTVHVGNMVAERAQTYNMFVDAVGRLQAFLHGPKDFVKKYVSGGKLGKNVSNDYLQYAFGVEPFVADVYGLGQALSKTLLDGNKSDFIKVRSGGSSTDSVEWEYDGSFYTDFNSVKTEVKARYTCEYHIDNATFSSLNSFGLVNPLEIAWEVTPWSFVVDWFLPIGKYISHLTAGEGMTFRGGTSSVAIKTTRTFIRKYKPNAYLETQGKEYIGSIKRTVVTETYDRLVLTNPPNARLPRFKSPFSLRHFALSLALWRQRR